MRAGLIWLLLLSGCEPDKDGGGGRDSAEEQDSGDSGDSGDSSQETVHVDWDEGCNPMATGNDCFLPYPTLYFTEEDASTATGRRLAYQIDQFWSPDGTLPVDPAIFNVADGAPPITQVLVNFGVDIHPDFLWGHGEVEASLAEGAAIALLNAETGERVPLLTEMDQNQRDLDYEGRFALILRPQAPLDFGAKYVAVLTQDLRDSEGAQLSSPAVFAALRDDVPTDSAVIEDLREHYAPLFATLAEQGYARENLLLAWDFQVASQESVLGPILSMRAQTLALAASEGVAYTITSLETDPNENVHLLVKGTFSPPNFLDTDNNLVLDGNDAVVQDEANAYPFTMIVPPSAVGGAPAPLVVFGHGIFGSGEGYLDGGLGESIIQPLANSQGAVMIATDWIGLSESDIELIIAEVVPDISRIQLVTDRLAQSLVNNLALTELALGDLQHDEALGLGGETFIDEDRVYYYGVSLGGVQGSSFVSLSPRISRAVLAVPGASWSNMIQRSTQFESIGSLVDVLYPDPLSQLMFVTLLQTYFDRSDPVNVGRLMVEDPDYGHLDRTVLLQEAIGDCQVPNMATEILSRTLGARHLEVAYEEVWGLDTVPSPATGVLLTQIVLPDNLADYTPPDQNTLPEKDNGTHGEATVSDLAFEQVFTLLGTGEAVHFCEGVCDPE